MSSWSIALLVFAVCGFVILCVGAALKDVFEHESRHNGPYPKRSLEEIFGVTHMKENAEPLPYVGSGGRLSPRSELLDPFPGRGRHARTHVGAHRRHG